MIETQHTKDYWSDKNDERRNLTVSDTSKNQSQVEPGLFFFSTKRTPKNIPRRRSNRQRHVPILRNVSSRQEEVCDDKDLTDTQSDQHTAHTDIGHVRNGMRIQ